MLFSGCQSRASFHGGQWRSPSASSGHFTLLSPLLLEEIFSPCPLRLTVFPSRLLRVELAGFKTVLYKRTGSSFKSFDQISAVWCHFDTCTSVAKIEMHTIIDHLPSACIYSTVKSNFSLVPLQYYNTSLSFLF